MTVLFGSYATSSTRAPSHAHEDNEDSMNRLFDDEATNVQDHTGDKLVSFDITGSLKGVAGAGTPKLFAKEPGAPSFYRLER